MQIYATQGYSDFILALGYLGDVIREYVRNLPYMYKDLVVETGNDSFRFLDVDIASSMRIRTLETGQDTETGGRIAMSLASISGDTCMLTYGDGVGNVNISDLLEFHKKSNRLVTVTAVRPPARFGNLTLDDQNNVVRFEEKIQTDQGWINGGFFVIEKQALNYFESDDEVFEKQVLNRLSKAGKLAAYKHFGFWQPMDTLRERDLLDGLAKKGSPPWMAI